MPPVWTTPETSRIWPPKLNGTVTAPAITAATIPPSNLIPSTRQKSLRTNLKEREIAGTICSRSSTMTDGAKLSIVPR